MPMTEEELQAQTAQLQADRATFEISRALTSASVRPDAIGDAALLLGAIARPEFDESGKISKVVIGDKEHASVAEAVADFLQTRPHFTASATPSTPTVTRTTVEQAPPKKVEAPKTLDDMLQSGYSPMDFAREGWVTPPK